MRPIKTSSDIKIAASQNIKEKDYWLKKLSGDPVKSHFPYDRAGTAGDERRLDTVNFQFSGELSSKLIKLSNKSDNRLHMIVTAGLAALLGKYTGNKDIIIGMPIFKQEVKGEFVNTVLPLRNKLEPGMTFKQLLLQLRETIFEAVEHQNYPMETLLYKLKIPSPGTAGFALFDAAILLENIQDRDYLRGIDYNMLFSLLRTGETIEGKLEYNASLYEKATGERITGHYLRLLTAALSNPDIPLSGIDILPEEEKNRVLFDFNNTAVEYPGDKTIHALLEDRVEMAPDKIAVVYKDRYLSYGGLNEKANRLARLLREKGVEQGSIVGIVMEPSPELIVGIVGIIKAGGAYLPVDHDYPERRILSILRDSGASILLTGENILKAMVFTALKGVGEGKAEPVVTQTRGQIKDFDGLPFPDRTLIDYEKYHRYIGIAMAKHTVSLQATRGCPYNCVYCHKIWPKNHVARSAENVFEEIRYCYDAGARRFVFIDDVFNLRKDNLARLMEKIIKNRLDIQIFFPNGLRGDILTREIVDLMVEGGTVTVDLALESASPRIQKLIRKNLDLEKFREIARYFTEKYPCLELEMELMIGFPTETEEEALMTLDFLKSLKWVHFPNLNILKIYPNTDMYRLAVEQGVSPQLIERSSSQAFHELPHTLPFPKSFAAKFQMDFMNRYFLSRERLLHVLPYQLNVFTEDELIQKYDSYLPMKIESFSDILETSGISMEELGRPKFLPQDHLAAPGFREKMREYFPSPAREDENSDAMRVLLLDLSLLFTSESENLLYHMVEEPLGLTYLITYLKKKFGRRIRGKIGKSAVDFDDFDRLKSFILDFNPDIIGIRTLTYDKEFFHKCVTLMRQWGIDIPIITGGPYATSDYRFVLNDPDIDLVVLGEGELTFIRLIEEMMGNEKKLPGDEVLKDIPGIAFVKKEDKALVRQASREVVFLDDLEEITASYPGENIDHVNHPGDMLYLISTSGSTGVPKSLMIENRNLVNLLNFQFKETPVDFKRVLQFASIGFDVSSQEIFSALLSGGELYLIDRETRGDVYRLLELMRKNQLNVIYWPPAFLKYVFSEPDHRADFPKSVKHIITAGEQLIITEPIRRYMKENHVYVHNHYGPAETHVVTTFIIEPSGDIPEFPPIGKPISNTRIYILDENKHPIPLGAAGELYIAGTNVGRGYHRRKELTAEKFMLDPFVEGEPMRMYRTGDLARWLPDGNLEFLGRADYQVKIRGFRIELAEIEQWLIRLEFIKEAVVVDFPDPNGEKYLCAYVVCPKEVEISEIRDFLAADLPGYMVPSYILRLEKIPLTPNGKVDIKALPRPEIQADETFAPPGDAVEEELAGIWSEVLGIEKTSISIDANFFELGGHSLKATILITRIHRAFNVKVALAEMFIHPTVRGLAGLIKEAGSDIFSAIEPVEKKEFYPLSSAQKRIYLIQRMKADNISYNNPAVMTLEGDLQKEKFEEALEELIERHESLRTSFEIIDEQVFQEVCENVEFAIEYNEMTEEEAGKRLCDFIRPFDLSRAPLMRVGLVKTGKSRHILMYDLHHIITDGTSMKVFVREFLALYGGKYLPPLRIQYRDFSGWQNRLFASGKIREQQEYWIKQLEGEIPVLHIPTDYPRPEIQHFEGSAVQFEIGRDVTAALNRLAKKQDATLYMVLLSIFNVLLSKLSGQEDIIIGTSIAGRRHADLHLIIGMFVNTLVMRNYPGGSKTFGDFLDEVRERTLTAFENQDYPFEELVEEVAVNRDTSRNPLFDVVFALQNMAIQPGIIPGVDNPGLNVQPYEYNNEDYGISAAKFDMTLAAVETGDRLAFIFEYSTRLFKKETIERFSAYFKRISEDIAGNADKKIADIEIISPEEKNRLLVEFNQGEPGYLEDKTIHGLFEEQARRTPDGVAVGVGAQGTVPFSVDHISITYKELNEKSDRLAEVLGEKGVLADDIVGIMVDRSIEMIEGIIGILKAGGAYLPIEPDCPEERIKYMLRDSGAKVLLSEGSEVSKLSEEIEVLDLSLPPAPCPLPPASSASSSNLAYIIYTSGTTGKPKGILTTHTNVIRVTRNTNYIDISEQDRILQLSNYAFDGSVFDIFGALLNGAALVIINKEDVFSVDNLAEAIKKDNITVFFVTTALFNTLIDLRVGCLDRVRKVLFGGELVSVEHSKRALKYMGKERILHVYGPTETTVYAAYYPVNEIGEGVGTIPIGRPITDTTVYILDNHLNPVPTLVCGEVYIGGGGVSRGYLNNPELTAEKFVYSSKRIYKTGDLARWLPDGNIEFVGRIDHQVKIRGFRIELGEIENRLSMHQEIKEAAVVSREDKQGIYRYLCAYFVSERELSASRLREYLSTSLPDYMIPSYFVQIDRIPLTPNGKLDREALPVPGVEAGRKYLAPRDEWEEKLVEIWCGVLGRDASHASQLQEIIGIDDNFFELGGHSLKATMMVSMIRREWNVNVPLVEVFKSPTIRGLAQYVRPDGNEIDITVNPAPDDHIVLLKSADNSSGHLFFIHDGSGEVEGYVEFCRHLEPQYNCWGIRAQRFENYAPKNLSIMEIAAYYLEKVKMVQPPGNGPYRLAGWSLGGTVAFEIVRQLEQMNEAIDLFAMIDVPAPDKKEMPGGRFKRESELNWLRHYFPAGDRVENLRDAQSIEDIWLYIVDFIQSNNIDAQIIREIINRFAGIVIPDYHRLSSVELIKYLNIIRSLDAARASYIPAGKINTPIYFFKTSRSGSIKHENWSEYACKPLKIHEITGDHYSIFKLPGVIDFAGKFGKILETL